MRPSADRDSERSDPLEALFHGKKVRERQETGEERTGCGLRPDLPGDAVDEGEPLS